MRTRIPARVALVALTLALCLAPAPSGAADPAAEATPTAAPEQPAPEAEPAADEELGTDTPRGALQAFLEAARDGDWERAAEQLNLTTLPSAERAARGPELARQLKIVLDRQLWLDPEILSSDPRGDRQDGLRAGRDRLGTIQTKRGDVDILLDRGSETNGERVWRFSAQTVARVPRLYEEFGLGVLGELLPKPFVEITLLEVALWQWIALVALLVLSWLLSWLATGSFVRLLRPLVRGTSWDFDDELLDVTRGPLRLLLTVALFAAGTVPLGLSMPARSTLGALEKALLLLGFTWLIFRLVDLIASAMNRRLRSRNQLGATAFVPMGSRAIKVALGALAFLAALDTFGFDVTALIAGLGVGGIAVALAAQKTVENVFGGVTLLTDQPVVVGDFCKFGDQVGTVEDIGLRSTRVRTLERTLVSVPNADFSTLHLENYARRDRMLLRTTLGLRYETTPEQLRHVLVGLREVLYAHPKLLPEPARVRFVGFGAYSLDLEVFAYAETADWNEFLGIREDVYLHFMDVVERSGSGFAFPSSTTYLAKDGGLDAERASEAEAQVAAWRERGALALPDFGAERIAELDDSLPWPPEGAPR